MIGVLDCVVAPATAVATEPNAFEYCPVAVAAWTGMLVAKIPASPKRTFKSVTVPEMIGACHLLVVDIPLIAAFWVPVLVSKASALITETAVVKGANEIGA